MFKKTNNWIALLLCMICISHVMVARTEMHICKRIAKLGDSYIDIDANAPDEPPTTVCQMKVERISLDKNKTTDLVKKYSLTPKKEESWVCEIGSRQNPDFELLFYEENGTYGSIGYSEASPRCSLDITDDGQLNADETARSFLDEMGIPYEYPFYTVAPLEKKAGDTRLIKIVARLMIDGIPCNTTIGWTRDSDSSGNGDPTPGVFLIVTEDGKLTAAVIRNPVNVHKRREDQTPIMNWDTVLEKNKETIINFFGTGDFLGSNMILKQIEFVMMVDAHQIAYPAWAYFFHLNNPGYNKKFEPYSNDMVLTYDARTGGEVW